MRRRPEEVRWPEDAHILVVDDDARLRALLSRYLAGEGFRVTTAETRADARDKLRVINPDMLVLDVMMPGESGLTLTESLRREQGTRCRCCCSPRAARRRTGSPASRPAPTTISASRSSRASWCCASAPCCAAPPPPVPETPLRPVPLGALEFDLERGELSGPDGAVRLTGGEAALLAALARKPNEVLSREDIAAALGMDEAGERAIDVQVTRLRRKIEADPREPRFLHTVRGRGYVLKPGN